MCHNDNVTLYKKFHRFVSRYALNYIEDELDPVKFVGVNNGHCRCIIRYTHCLFCACELVSYIMGSIPLDAINFFWTRLSFADMSMQQEFDVIVKHFAEVDIARKVIITSKLHEIAYPHMNSMYPLFDKVKTKESQKGHACKLERSTKRDPSYFEHVDTLHSVNDNSFSWKSSKALGQKVKLAEIYKRNIPMLDQFHVNLYPSYMLDIIDVKANGHCGYHAAAACLTRYG